MSRRPSPQPLIIDARPRGPHGPLAQSKILGRTALEHLLDAAETAGREPVVIHAREDEHEAFAVDLAKRDTSKPYRLVPGPPPEGAAVLRTDRLYDPARLKRALAKGASPETAVVWRLDGPHALAGADDELLRRRTYQPIGRYWALAPARWLAKALAATRVRPNHLTLLSGTLMLTGAAATALAVPGHVAAACMAAALVLDTADGHLARLQGTASRFGRWLDAMLDELGDMALHAGIAWAAFAATGRVGWLAVGMAYGMCKYLFYVGNTIWTEGEAPRPGGAPALVSPRGARGAAHLIGHADVRWHLWILLALIGRLDLGLVAYAVYFAARVIAGAARKAGGSR